MAKKTPKAKRKGRRTKKAAQPKDSSTTPPQPAVAKAPEVDEDRNFRLPIPRYVGGRPPKMVCDEKTLGIIRGLARIQCKQKMAAGVFGVHENTFNTFLAKHPEARLAWESGIETGKMSILQMQYAIARRSPTMLIWLGKQHLGQVDKIEERIEATIESVTMPRGKPVDSFTEISDNREAMRRFLDARAEMGKKYTPRLIDITPPERAVDGQERANGAVAPNGDATKH